MRRPLVIALAILTTATLTPAAAHASERSAAPFAMAPGMLAAMARDLGLDDDQIAARLRTEAVAPAVEKRLTAELGSAFAGAWIPDGGTRLTVAVTDTQAEASVRAAGANPELVQRDAAALSESRTKLDRNASHAAAAKVRGWYVDVPGNRVVVLAAPGASASASAFAKASGAGAVRVVTEAEQPRTMYDVRGGDQYVINGNTLCSIGFAVAGGFVSAGATRPRASPRAAPATAPRAGRCGSSRSTRSSPPTGCR